MALFLFVFLHALLQVSRNGLRRIVEALFATLGNVKTAQLLLVHTRPAWSWQQRPRVARGMRRTARDVRTAADSVDRLTPVGQASYFYSYAFQEQMADSGMDIRVAMFKLHSLVFDEPELLVDPTARPPPRPNKQTNTQIGGDRWDGRSTASWAQPSAASPKQANKQTNKPGGPLGWFMIRRRRE
jgi:hypothetical protein